MTHTISAATNLRILQRKRCDKKHGDLKVKNMNYIYNGSKNLRPHWQSLNLEIHSKFFFFY